MSTLGSRLVCLVVAGMGGLFVSAADYNQTVDLGTRCSGDAVNATATPPGTVLTGGVSNPGGFTWSGGPASFDGTIPRTFSGSHAGNFSGTYRPKGQGSDGESTINTWEMGTAAMVVKVDLIPIPSGNTPELVNGRICINAQPSYKKAKWKAVVKPSGTTATVTPISGGVAISGGSGISDGATFWVTGGAKTGDYKIKITHDSCASCTASGGEKVFKFNIITTDTASLGHTGIATCNAYDDWNYLANANRLSNQASDGHFCKVSLGTTPAGSYIGNVRVNLVVDEITESGVVVGPLLRGDIARNSLFDAITSLVAITIPRTALSINLPESASGAAAGAGIAITVEGLNGDGPTTRGPFECQVTGFSVSDPFLTSFNTCLTVSVAASRTFNLGASPTQTVQIASGFAACVAANPGKNHKARALCGADLDPSVMKVQGDSYEIVTK